MNIPVGWQGVLSDETKTHYYKELLQFIEKEYKPWVLSHHKRGEETLATLTRCFEKLFSKPLIEITPLLLEPWCIKRLNEGVSNVTLNRNIATLKSVDKSHHVHSGKPILFWSFTEVLNFNGGYGWTRTTDLSIMSAAL